MRTETEIDYMLVDATAAADGIPAASTKQPWNDLNQLHDEDDTHAAHAWATLEPDEGRLDGSMELLPAGLSDADAGLWSAEQSDENGVFAAPPVLNVSFHAPHTSLGITLEFTRSGDWASDLHIAWLDAAGAKLAERDFAPDGESYFCDCLVHSYYRVILTFRATNKPRRWLKLHRVRYGVVESLRGDALTAAEIVEEADPISASVSVNTLHFGFHADRRFDLLDLTGVYAVFQQQQRVRVRQRVDGVTREMGLFYTDVPMVEDERAVSIDCIDLVGVLEQTEFWGGLWPDGIRAGALLAEIMESAGTAEYELDASLKEVMVYGYLPVCTHRQALQQAAFAIGAVVSCARSDQIRIYPMRAAPLCAIAPRDKVAGHKQTQRAYVSGVEVYTHQYVLSEDGTELFKAQCKAGEQLVRFSGPAAALSCGGASIVESGVNYARLSVPAAGLVTLSGRAYNDQTSLGGSVYAPTLPPSARANIRTVEDCTLTADAQTLAQRLYAVYQRRVEDSGDVFPVAAAAGDTAALQTAGGRTLTGMVESMEIDLYGGGIVGMVVAGESLRGVSAGHHGVQPGA